MDVTAEYGPNQAVELERSRPHCCGKDIGAVATRFRSETIEFRISPELISPEFLTLKPAACCQSANQVIITINTIIICIICKTIN